MIKLKILILASGSKGEISPIIKNQIDSLVKHYDLCYDLKLIKGGISGYLKTVIELWGANLSEYALIHAHYSLCGIVAYLGSLKRVPVICSLMGSDIYSSEIMLKVSRIFAKYLWNETIVKSWAMHTYLKAKDAQVIPNGVNIQKFSPMDKLVARKKLGWSFDERIILFAANPSRSVKNYPLAEESVKRLNSLGIDAKLKSLISIPNDKIPLYYNASDVVLLTSFWEGSPNVVKEAMACNRPVVSTNVGDISERFAGADECYITDYNSDEIALQLKTILVKKKEIFMNRILIASSLSDEKISDLLMRVFKKNIK